MSRSTPTDAAKQSPAERSGPARWLHSDIVLLAMALGVLLWLTGQVLLIVFAGILLAIALDGLAELLTRATRLPRGWSLVSVIVVLVLLAAAGGSAIVPQFIEQFGQLWQQLGRLGAGVGEAIQEYPWLEDMMGAANEDGGLDISAALGPLASATITTLGAAGTLFLVVIIGAFAAADPGLYQRGMILMVPSAHRPRAKETLIALGQTLRWWLLGQLVAMLVLGVSTAIGLYLLGVELWLGLAVLVGLLTFIPFLGPIIAGIPVVLVGFGEGMQTGLAVLAFYLIVQNLEGNVLTPMIQRRAVRLPPAMLISMQILFGTLFGAAGLILASPLAVVVMVVIQLLYLEDVLGERMQT